MRGSKAVQIGGYFTDFDASHIAGTGRAGRILLMLGAVLAVLDSTPCKPFASKNHDLGSMRSTIFFSAPLVSTSEPKLSPNVLDNTDFTRSNNSCLVNYQLIPVEKGQYIFGEDQVWAEADIEQAAWFMKKLASDAAYAKEIGLKGKQTIASEFSPSVIGQLYQKRLDHIDKMKN